VSAFDDLRRSVVRSTVIRAAALGGPLGLLLSVYYALWGPLGRSPSHTLAVINNVLLFFAYAAVMTPILIWAGSRYLRSALVWMKDDRPPTDDEREGLVRLPSRLAKVMFMAMLAVALLTSIGGYIGERDVTDQAVTTSVRVFVGLALTALTFGAFAYLVGERSLRPVFAIAFRDADPGKARTMSVRLRFIVGWALGSGIPLLFLLAIPLGSAGRDALPIHVPLIFMASTGLFVGLVTTIVTARSVADPLAAVEEGLRRVERGDLETTIPVDDAGEVGKLQSSFNRMVQGLRERTRLQDLFGRHVGDEVAQRALDEGVQLGGERREVSVFFVDLIGSTSLAESQTPEEVVAVLNDLFGSVVRVVADEDGWVDKFEGDAAMCVFGAPVARDDHAARALRAARLLLDAVHAEGRLDVGIGVSTGSVVAGNIGTAERYSYTVIGSAANEAARLSDHAKTHPSRLVASARAVNAAGAEAQAWQQAGTVRLRGMSDETEIFEPVGRSPGE
jgi:adenylate cyclase